MHGAQPLSLVTGNPGTATPLSLILEPFPSLELFHRGGWGKERNGNVPCGWPLPPWLLSLHGLGTPELWALHLPPTRHVGKVCGHMVQILAWAKSWLCPLLAVCPGAASVSACSVEQVGPPVTR